MAFPECFIEDVGIANALGRNRDTVYARMLAGDTSGMVVEHDWLVAQTPARVGRVAGELPKIPRQFAALNCRNNSLLLLAFEQIRPAVEQCLRHVPRGRIGVILGTSTSGILEGEQAVASLEAGRGLPKKFHYAQQEIGMAAPFLAQYIGITGPAYTISTACTSSAKALISARNLLRSNICDAVIAGGVDSLCKLTINGFSALEATTPELTNPMSRNRNGINIGEAAALMLLTRQPSAIALLGAGETSDAYHISSPDPTGHGAAEAMRTALSDAAFNAKDIGYLNLHATATRKNDEMEALAVDRIFPEGIACSGSKPLTGHTLGAAGATEAALCWLAMQGEGQLPPHIWDGEADPQLPSLHLTGTGDRFRPGRRICMSNSFAFGGSNVSLIIGQSA
jgi:3-oxoacyl-[acyl-carrier-protein] synthase-1